MKNRIGGFSFLGLKHRATMWRELKVGAVFRQQTKPRDEETTEPSDGEARVVEQCVIAVPGGPTKLPFQYFD